MKPCVSERGVSWSLTSLLSTNMAISETRTRCCRGVCRRAETERTEWMKERDDKLENMSTKLKELKSSLKERNRVVAELERSLSDETAALEASRTRASESEAGAAELQMKLAEMRRTVDERDEQLQTLQDELIAVCVHEFMMKGVPGCLCP